MADGFFKRLLTRKNLVLGSQLAGLALAVSSKRVRGSAGEAVKAAGVALSGVGGKTDSPVVKAAETLVATAPAAKAAAPKVKRAVQAAAAKPKATAKRAAKAAAPAVAAATPPAPKRRGPGKKGTTEAAAPKAAAKAAPKAAAAKKPAARKPAPKRGPKPEA